ncbi:hypothetical protein C8250_040480 [Streptomyces sp. So13.3]|uniref:hypothetical protein n=1 Tax=Streptomyces TaxID=1883 RepID=UPI0011067E10|nr:MULTISPECIES: hypothetical protein [Streptomyces]MCZ4102713.1 hypothetical protein [Streptomyces sp. H39-C1]QNA77274.1 hypothetical protein C8250_040480 [Streptomyces sp. So13.3]
MGPDRHTRLLSSRRDVRSGDWNAGDSHAITPKALFISSGWICQNTTTQAAIQSYGFLPSASCGVF